MVTHPTVVVGVGKAGISVMSRVQSVARENNDLDMFEFIALDGDKDMLNNAPDTATTLALTASDDYLGEDREKYPYLTEDMRIEGPGARRQRSVGRYKVDRRGDGGHQNKLNDLRTVIENHHNTHDQRLNEDTASFNIFLIHSFGGGTGSGSFPLLLSMLHEIGDSLDTDNELIYLGGVGVVPEIPVDIDVGDPPGNSNYYPNTYAALNDLETYTDLYHDEIEDLHVPIYARDLDGERGPSYSNVPFSDCWLVGVEEDKISGNVQITGDESYEQLVDESIARSITAISRLDGSAENWSNSMPYPGTFKQTEVRVPHGAVEEYAQSKKERAEKQEKIETTIPDQIKGKENRQEELEDLKSGLDDEQIDDDSLRERIKSDIDGKYANAEQLVDASAEEIENFLDRIEADYEAQDKDVEALIIATSILEERVQEERGAPQVEQEWQDTVDSLWDDYDMQGSEGTSSVTSPEAKASLLEEELDDSIDKYTDIKDDWDSGLLGSIQDFLPPIDPLGVFESDREEAEAYLDILKSDHSELKSIMNQWDRVTKIVRTIEDRQLAIRDLIDEQLDEINREISELQGKRDQLTEDVRALEADIERLKEYITTERTSDRLAEIPIKESRLDDLDHVTVENRLTSLQAYVDEGYVDGEKVRFALNQRQGNTQAWDERIMDRDTNRTDKPEKYDRKNELWYLYSEENENIFDEYLTQPPEGAHNQIMSQAGEDAQLQFLPNPYRISMVGFTHRGPVGAFEVYLKLEELADNKDLDGLANQYDGDHRLAFGYMEWYEEEIQRAFDVRFTFRIPRPPELKRGRVDKPDLEKGKLADYIVNPGLTRYLWHGNMMDDYQAGEEVFRGWKRAFGNNGLSYQDLQQASPEPRFIREWLADQRSWDEVLQEFQENLIDRTNRRVVFTQDDD
jgi:hypothetical protein